MASLIAAKLPAQICAVISNDPAAKGLATAAGYGIATAVVDHRHYKQRADFDAALAQQSGLVDVQAIAASRWQACIAIRTPWTVLIAPWPSSRIMSRP